jgi:ankyrin
MKMRLLLLPLLALYLAVSNTHASNISSQHDTEQYTPLFAAASAGDLATVKAAIEKDKSLLNATEWDDATLLHLAVGQNHKDLVLYLLEQGANVNAVTKSRLTSLHMAAQNANITIAVMLLTHGATINPIDSKGWTPLDRAEKWHHPLTSAFLRKNGGKEGSHI